MSHIRIREAMEMHRVVSASINISEDVKLFMCKVHNQNKFWNL